MRDTAKEAIRLLRRVDVVLTDGAQKYGSGFLGAEPGTVVTCAHVVTDGRVQAKTILVDRVPATLRKVYPDIDIAILEVPGSERCEYADSKDVVIGDVVTFAGYPTGVSGPSVFSGILSARGSALIRAPRCELLQINGMINSGNSGGPVLLGGTAQVVGVITAKFVPLLEQIDQLREVLKAMPQFPKEVGIGNIDFSAFVNFVMEAFARVSGTLRLVQVGTGYAVPSNLVPR